MGRERFVTEALVSSPHRRDRMMVESKDDESYGGLHRY